MASFPNKTKSKTQKTIEDIAPFYKYNPYTPHHFKSIQEWESYLKECSDMSKGHVRAKVNWLHKRLGHWWCEHRKEKHTLEYYNKHYGKNAKDEDKMNPNLMPRRMQYAVNTINSRLSKNWVKPPPAMASHSYWESFLYNCIDLKVLEKLDIILIDVLKYIDKKKEKPVSSESRDKCLTYLKERKSSPQSALAPEKKRTW